IHSVELLIEALNRYKGSIVLVSHDRYFISKVANKIWEIDNLKIKEFAGGYEEQVQWKKRMEEKGPSVAVASTKASQQSVVPVRTARPGGRSSQEEKTPVKVEKKEI